MITSDDSQEKVNGDSPNSNNSLDKLKVHPKNNMRININNINILINRHLQNDVTINIDMDENNEAEIVEIDEQISFEEEAALPSKFTTTNRKVREWWSST